MNYIIIGLLLSIGWHLASVIYEVAVELLFCRLRNARWYQIAAGKRPKTIQEQPGDIQAVKSKIGFSYIEKES